MTKKDFAARLGASVKAQDTAASDRFKDAESLLSKLPKPGDSTSQQAPEKLKTKISRGSFSMEETDYEIIRLLRVAAAQQGVLSTASEIVRAALHAVVEYDGPAIVQALEKLPRLRPGKKS